MKFEINSIGKIFTPYNDNAPYQPIEDDEGEFFIEIDPEYEKGLYKLKTFKYIYVIYYIDRIKSEVNYIIDIPWADNFEVGVFASRSPVRPNKIGISIVKIKNIEKNKISVSGLDVFNETIVNSVDLLASLGYEADSEIFLSINSISEEACGGAGALCTEAQLSAYIQCQLSDTPCP